MNDKQPAPRSLANPLLMFSIHNSTFIIHHSSFRRPSAAWRRTWNGPGDDRVFLKIVANARDVSGHFHAVRQPDTRHLPQSRVRLLGGLGINADADAALLRRTLERRAGGLVTRPLPPQAHQLTERRHANPSNPIQDFDLGTHPTRWGPTSHRNLTRISKGEKDCQPARLV